jgi:hypothetical protein
MAMIECWSNHKRKRCIWKTSLLRSQIDAILNKDDDWRGEMLSRLRALIKQADPAFVEEVKWKKPSRPEGVPVWSHDGILCFGDTLKNAVRLTFPKGAQMKDPHKLFNTRKDSQDGSCYRLSRR